MNPEAGHEADPPAPTIAPRHVLVAGGGPAGLECARRLAERGHRVELWEASDRLGGHLALAEQADPDLAGLLAWLVGGAEDAGVTIRTGRSVEAPVDADVLVWAIGAPWPGDPDLGLDDLRPWLAGTESLVGPLIVHGSGKAAVSVALRARREGLAVALVPDTPVLAPELGLPGRFRLVAAAEHAGVTIGNPALAGTGTVVRILPAPGLPPPPHAEVHVIGDASGSTGLAAAFAAAAEVAARL